MTIYKSPKNIQFKLEMCYYFYCVFLPEDEVKDYCQIQMKHIFATLPANSGKKLSLKQYIQYHVKQWQTLLIKQCNLFNRDIDLTNNLIETFNKFFAMKHGKKLHFYKFLTALQRIFALSSLIFQKLELYNQKATLNSELIFNRAKNNILKTFIT